MTDPVTDAEARLALEEVERGRRRVIDRIGMPWWYWGGLAACWIALGVLNDVASAWVIAVATVTFGAVHSAVCNGSCQAGDSRADSGSAPMWPAVMPQRSSSVSSSRSRV